MPAVQQTIELLMCDVCSRALTEDDQAEGSSLCHDCIDSLLGRCEYCHTYIYNDGLSVNTMRLLNEAIDDGVGYRAYPSDTDEDVCDNCICMCERCDAQYVSSDNAYECCDSGGSEDYLHNYGFNPGLMFWDVENWDTARSRAKPNTLYMGMELEAEKLDSMETWHGFLNLLDDDHWDPRYVYGKTDGSLDSTGVEIVTMPSTLESHRQLLKEDGLKHLRNHGVRAWHRSRCGMHIHVSRSAFTVTHMYKFVFWQAMMRDYCATFAGRRSERWASWDGDAINDAKNKTSEFIKNKLYPRYTAINNNPHNTVELRYFRPNLTKSGIMRVLEFVDAIYNYTKSMTISDLVRMKTTNPFELQYEWNLFVEFISDKPQYMNAYRYIKQEWNINQESE